MSSSKTGSKSGSNSNKCCFHGCSNKGTFRDNGVRFCPYHKKHCHYPQCNSLSVKHDEEGAWCNKHQDKCTGQICPSSYLKEWSKNFLCRTPAGTVCSLCQKYPGEGYRAIADTKGVVTWVKRQEGEPLEHAENANKNVTGNDSKGKLAVVEETVGDSNDDGDDDDDNN